VQARERPGAGVQGRRVSIGPGGARYNSCVVHAFGSCELNLERSELYRDGRLIPLAPKAFEVLRFLIENRGRVVFKTELLEQLWPGENISQSSLHRTVADLRRAIGQTDTREAPIQTLYGRGYCFVDPVRSGEAGADVPESPPSLTGREPFVGRDEVLAELRVALRAAQGGRGRFCVLAGEAGIGKTRCSQELASEALAGGASVWTAYCQAADGAPAFWPWVQILRACAREEPELEARASALLAELAPELSGGPQRPALPSFDPNADRFRILDAVAQLILSAGEQRTRVVILDDLQRCPKTSLEVLSVLVPRLERARVLVLGTARDDVDSDESSISLRHPLLVRAQRISLGGWSSAEVERYVTAVSGRPEAAPVGRELHRKIGGNPFFVQETLRLLIARDGLASDEACELTEVALPDAVRQLVGTRIAELDGAARELVQVASAIGESFSLPVLVRALRKTEQELLPLLAQAILHRILVRGAAIGEYEFRHALIRRIAYDEIAEDSRAALHALIADAIEAQSAGTAQLGEIAYHLHQALPTGTHAKLRRYAAEAGAQASRVHAYAEAARCYGWVLDAQAFDASVSPRERGETHLRIALFLLSAGDERASREHLSRCIDIARHHGFGNLLALAAGGLRTTAMLARVEDPLARAAFEVALRSLPEEERILRIRVQSHLACMPPTTFTPDVAREQSAEALRGARRLGDPLTLKDALAARMQACLDPDHLGEALELADEIVALAHCPGGRLDLSLDGYLGQFQVQLRLGDLNAAERALDAYGRMAERVQYPEATWTHRRYFAQRLDHQGRFAEADAYYADLEQRGRELNIRLYARLIRWVRVRFARLRAAAGPVRISTAHAYVHASTTRFAIEGGALELGRAEFGRLARAGLERLPRDACFLATLADLACAAELLGDARAAEVLYAQLEPHADLNVVDDLCVYTGSVSHSLGLLARTLGRNEAAVAHFERALEMNARLQLRPFAAQTRYELARTLLGHASASPARIRELLETSGAEAKELGMAPLAASIEALRRAARGERGRPAQRSHARERAELKP
jgi:eukaryotic-like serine/threonine-protein kinase